MYPMHVRHRVRINSTTHEVNYAGQGILNFFCLCINITTLYPFDIYTVRYQRWTSSRTILSFSCNLSASPEKTTASSAAWRTSLPGRRGVLRPGTCFCQWRKVLPTQPPKNWIAMSSLSRSNNNQQHEPKVNQNETVHQRSILTLPPHCLMQGSRPCSTWDDFNRTYTVHRQLYLSGSPQFVAMTGCLPPCEYDEFEVKYFSPST